MAECVHVGCTNPAEARGLCNAHYLQLLRRTGYQAPRLPARPKVTDRYPIGPLLERMARRHVTVARDIAAELRISDSTLKHHRAHGVTWATADRLAVRAGYHPAQIWPTWVDDALTVLDHLHLENGWRQAWLWNEQQRTQPERSAA